MTDCGCGMGELCQFDDYMRPVAVDENCNECGDTGMVTAADGVTRIFCTMCEEGEW